MKLTTIALAIIGLEPLKDGLMGTLLRYRMRCPPKTSISMTFRT
jgi:hypothetical protein